MKKITPLLYLLLCFMVWSCYTPESLRGFDSETWKADKNACKGDRAKLSSEFEKIRKELYGKKEYIVRNVLGKPDKEDLLERSQRIYYYYLEAGPQCQDNKILTDVNRAEVRINSLGKVSEITYNNPDKIIKPE
ncbi:hypothetical protein H8S95_04245 [Pontibacter sp. KCTC 32443]|uniref:hypothetical protein n=1 Tax=Pontibacter TaxID=323449 RepID=UPI00164EA463|nr:MULTISPECIES: hypothetical protein [Pontibacter]MBC5773265.1 hypothetical protein [Pontibacter sp. KCTC 32443]